MAFPVALTATAVALSCCCMLASAEPLVEGMRKGGAISRHVWQPEFASTNIAGVRVSAGLAIGLRDPVRATLMAAAAPSVSMQLAHNATLTLLPISGRGGAMLVLELRN